MFFLLILFLFPSHISYQESRNLICSANQWTGLYMIGASVMKELHAWDYCLWIIDQPSFIYVWTTVKPRDIQQNNSFTNFRKLSGKHHRYISVSLILHICSHQLYVKRIPPLMFSWKYSEIIFLQKAPF